VINGETGECLASSFHPKKEMEMLSHKPGWAEQDPEKWWENLRLSIADCLSTIGSKKDSIGSIGISYQMHGLVCVDKDQKVLRPSIIWCDSRAVEYGNKAAETIGKEFCLAHLLNSPGNFTASKLAWVKQNEPDIFSRIDKVMLPGDYIAMRLTGEIHTSFSGLSEGIFWDFTKNAVSDELMKYYGFDRSILADAGSSFAVLGNVTAAMASELGLPKGIPVAYRAGDQPNNALSLNVLNPGEVAATAGTSGVIYGVTDQKKYDPQSRVNTFLHVNHSEKAPRLGVLLCINGTGILNSWIKRVAGKDLSYDEMNQLAATVAPGSEGVTILPFGNGAERMLMNNNPGSRILGVNFNTHNTAHLFRAAQEGIAFSFKYGLDIMKETGINPQIIRAGSANMFLSNIFRETLSTITSTEIHLYNTDGSVGAARGAGIGCGYYKSEKEAFNGLKSINLTTPDKARSQAYADAYERWREQLGKM
ncbi:MAG TPA: FGGY family carbohydrate kinase, partial [Bacteroidales bacterium]|nr:FGGY family carbohydrate kinase [Bacteroidales bacterium]